MYWTENKLKEFAADIYNADNYGTVAKKYNISSAYAAVIASLKKFPHPKISARHGGKRKGSGQPRKFKKPKIR